MSIFAISDLHLSFSADKPMDVFRGWEGYVDKLKLNWENTVKNEDFIILPGDLSWSLKLEDTLEDFLFLSGLPGKKYLLKGNHDLWWNSITKMNNFLQNNDIDNIHFIHNNSFCLEGITVCGTRGWFFDDVTADKKVLLREALRLETSILDAKKNWQ